MSLTYRRDTPLPSLVSLEGVLPSTGSRSISLARFCQVWLRFPLISLI